MYCHLCKELVGALWAGLAGLLPPLLPEHSYTPGNFNYVRRIIDSPFRTRDFDPAPAQFTDTMSKLKMSKGHNIERETKTKVQKFVSN
jgi:hypothetical protein